MGKAVISVYLDGIADGNEDWIRQVGTDDSLDSLWPPDYDPFEYADKQQRTRLGAKEQRASRKHSGTMVALVPSDGSWCHQDDPHVTLVYAGELAPDDPTIERLLGICRELASQTHVMAVPVTGTAVFGEGEDQVDVLTLEKTPELAQLRAVLEWANGSQYTDYKPHATIGPVGSANDDLPDQLVLTSLWMVTGNDEWTWPLPREARTAGLGGQFAKGGGRVPGRGVTEVSPAEMDRLLGEIAPPFGDDGLQFSERLTTTAAAQRAALSDGARQAVEDYGVAAYKTVNQALRTGNLDDLAGTRAGDTVVGLDEAFSTSTASLQTVVYRGVRGTPPDLQPGDRFVDDGYVSTSESGRVALGFATTVDSGTAVTVYRIRSKSDASVVVGETAEGEWLLPRGSAFSVTGVTRSGERQVVDLVWEGST